MNEAMMVRGARVAALVVLALAWTGCGAPDGSEPSGAGADDVQAPVGALSAGAGSDASRAPGSDASVPPGADASSSSTSDACEPCSSDADCEPELRCAGPGGAPARCLPRCDDPSGSTACDARFGRDLSGVGLYVCHAADGVCTPAAYDCVAGGVDCAGDWATMWCPVWAICCGDGNACASCLGGLP